MSSKPATCATASGIGTRPERAWPAARRPSRPRPRSAIRRRRARPRSSTGSRAVTRTRSSSSRSIGGVSLVVLVGDLADDLLQHVLDRDEPGRAAVLVDRRSPGAAGAPASPAAARRPACDSGTNYAGAHGRPRSAARSQPSCSRAHEVLEEGDADDVVDVLPDRPGCGRSRCAAHNVTACAIVLVRSIQTISVRGTMTSRTRVSPSSKTDAIMSRSPRSTTPRSSARSTRSRSSASVANGPSRIALARGDRVAEQDQQRGQRPETRAERGVSRGVRQATAVRVLAAEGAGRDTDERRSDDQPP